MTAAFIIELDTGSDTDLIGIAEDLAQVVDGQEGFVVISCKPWAHPTLATGQTPPVVPGQQTT